ncbi:hypothetical protein B0T10DRAFT_461389 [Thelonectria olida]|uniref:Sterigmatocystin biosynthesis monooxygenase stcW n=1 Tax=Thelonectria olida TaxID=1576542 RepID=A0A9P8W137_9HYPO|nr:hypothetical protein B0T10DRAFT_461389 [Thelonectria olida]
MSNSNNQQVNGHVNGHKDDKNRHNWAPVADQPVYTPRKLRVVCVGAGYAGLMVAYKWKHEYHMDDFVDLTIYEKNSDVGGTWLENRYPGVACDVPAHIYTFSFEPNPNWSSFYARGPEIWEYIKKTTQKYNLDERVQLNSKVLSTIWDDAKGKWAIKVQINGEIKGDEADVVINGSGILNKWRWPDIKGLHSFRGELLHSASWDETLDWTGKRVAMIGNGSSAIQMVPKMQPAAGKIVNYIRSPTWISSNFAAEFTPDGKNFQYTEEQKQSFRDHPETLRAMQREIEHGFNKFFYALVADSPEQKAVYEGFKKNMEERLNHDPELCARLIPSWKVGCRRLSPGDGYLEALQASNVSVEFGHIQEITQKGIKTANSTEEFDVIVCATGFDVSFCPFWELRGKNGIRLSEQWSENPEAYFGICAPNIPNYFIFNGPNCPVGHGSLLAVMEWTADWILKWCRKISCEDIKSVAVSSEATDDYNVYSQEFMKKTVWTSGCQSWYKNGNGRVTAMYAGSILHYKEILESFRSEDFHFEYNGRNRFSFMGNGLTIREVKGENLAFYLK